MITARDPVAMTESERFGEIAEILARGYVRLLIRRECSEKALDDCDPSEAPCDSRAHNPRSNEDAA